MRFEFATATRIIFGEGTAAKRPEEREFYLRLAVKAKWSKRELAYRIKTAALERTVLSDKKLAALPRLLPQDATGVFKDIWRGISNIQPRSDICSGILFAVAVGRLPVAKDSWMSRGVASGYRSF
jgi:hypothetical protein